MMATNVEVRHGYKYSLRSQQVLAVIFICCVITFILMSVCLISSYWITADGFRQGLLYLCIEELGQNSKSRADPLPFDLSKEDLEPGCYPNRDVGYLKLCTFFCLITQLSSMASACLTGLSMRTRGLRMASYLKFATCTTLVTLICDIALLIIYPTQFTKEIERSNRDLWELNGAYGLACGSAILASGNLILLVVTLRAILNTFETNKDSSGKLAYV